MTKFLFRSTLFIAIVGISILLVFFQADGYSDPFYIRFTTPKQSSLILGTSRAAQGIHPVILNKVLLRNDMFNYSFTINISPYGPTYLKSIKKKLDTISKNGIFILTVDPWSISSISENPDDKSNFRELEKKLNKVQSVNTFPNLQYLAKLYDKQYYDIIKGNKNMFLHKDGWLEVNIIMDSIIIKDKIERKVKSYLMNTLPKYKFSLFRLKFLIKTIKYLDNYGEVYLVRLPVHPKIMEVDNMLINNFNDKIKEAINKSSGYYDMTRFNDEFIYTDGNHLYKKSGIKVSEDIANWILKSENNVN